MAHRTAAQPARVSWAPRLLAGEDVDRTPRRRDDPAPAQEIATRLAVILCLAAGLIFTAGAKVGSRLERGSQLGQVLALAPQRDSVEAALAWARTLQARLARLPRPAQPPQNRAGMPLETTISLPTPQVPTLPLPQIRP